MKKLLLTLSCFTLLCCGGNNAPPNILLFPRDVSIDAAHNRLFVVDAQNNNLSLIDLTNHTIVTGNPLLNSTSAIRLPQLPQDIAVADLGGDTTRIFIIGNGPAPRNRITVLDYDATNGLRVASFSPLIVGTDTDADTSDVLAGLAFDAVTGNLFVSNSTDSVVRVYSIQDGSEQTGSPITVNAGPSKMKINSSTSQLFVSSLGGNSISVIATDQLSAAPASVDVGVPTGSVASATHSTGTLLFVLNPTQNEILVFNFNPTTAAITQIGSTLTAPSVGQADSSTNAFSGAAAEISAAPLADGTLAGVFTQSTGDLGFIDVASDLSSFTSGRVTVLNGLGATGMDILKDSSGNGTKVYYAAPGGSAVTFVDITTNQYGGQIL